MPIAEAYGKQSSPTAASTLSGDALSNLSSYLKGLVGSGGVSTLQQTATGQSQQSSTQQNQMPAPAWLSAHSTSNFDMSSGSASLSAATPSAYNVPPPLTPQQFMQQHYQHQQGAGPPPFVMPTNVAPGSASSYPYMPVPTDYAYNASSNASSTVSANEDSKRQKTDGLSQPTTYIQPGMPPPIAILQQLIAQQQGKAGASQQPAAAAAGSQSAHAAASHANIPTAAVASTHSALQMKRQ